MEHTCTRRIRVAYLRFKSECSVLSFAKSRSPTLASSQRLLALGPEWQDLPRQPEETLPERLSPPLQRHLARHTPCTEHPKLLQVSWVRHAVSGLQSQHLLCPVLFIPLFPSQTNSTDPSGLHLEPLSPGSLPGCPPTVPSTRRPSPAAFLPTALRVGGWVGGGVRMVHTVVPDAQC